MRILGISGSLQEASSNSALLRGVRDAATTVDVVLWQGLGDLPPFRPDVDGDVRVVSLRHAVGDADAVLVATPEYAGGMPGTLKNALDWLVGSGELYGKPVVVVSAAPSAQRGHNARRWVADVVTMQGADVRDSFTVAVARGDGAARVDTQAGEVLRRVLDALGRAPTSTSGG